MIYLTNFESSLVQLMLGIGLVLMLPAVLDKESRLHRTLPRCFINQGQKGVHPSAQRRGPGGRRG